MSGVHAGFVVVAYALCGATILAAVTLVSLDYRTQLRALARLDAPTDQRR